MRRLYAIVNFTRRWIPVMGAQILQTLLAPCVLVGRASSTLPSHTQARWGTPGDCALDAASGSACSVDLIDFRSVLGFSYHSCHTSCPMKGFKDSLPSVSRSVLRLHQRDCTCCLPSHKKSGKSGKRTCTERKAIRSTLIKPKFGLKRVCAHMTNSLQVLKTCVKPLIRRLKASSRSIKCFG
jgi:hypothetical protein